MQHDPSKAFVLLNNLGLGRRLGHDWTDRCGHLLIYLHRPFLFIHLAYTDTHSHHIFFFLRISNIFQVIYRQLGRKWSSWIITTTWQNISGIREIGVNRTENLCCRWRGIKEGRVYSRPKDCDNNNISSQKEYLLNPFSVQKEWEII